MDAPITKGLKEIDELKCNLINDFDKRHLDNTVSKNLSAVLENDRKDGICSFNDISNDVKVEKCEDSFSKNGSEETKEVKLESNEYQSEKISIKTENYAENCDNNDESMILTIEEDEQKLMHEEAQDTVDKEKRENETDLNAKEKDTTDEKSKESKKLDENISETLNEKEKDLEESSTVNSKPKTTTSSRNLWISGLSTITRASDLKLIFSKYGKVVGAKVVTNTRTPGTRCYGYVTMSSSSEATRCIQHLHCTELHGRIISVERTKNEVGNTSTANSRKRDDRKSSEKSIVKFDPDNTDAEKKGEKHLKSECDDKANAEKVEIKNSPVKKENIEEKNSDNKQKVTSSSYKSKSRSSRSSSSRNNRVGIRSDHKKDKNGKSNVLSYERIREERERQRIRERERALREEERRRIEIRRRQREEEQRLIREREKLAIEREKIEKEKAELLRMERERQKLEREKIELEKMELKRQQKSLRLINNSRIDENKRIKRMADGRFTESSIERKRRLDRGERRIEAPPPPRFDSSADSSYDKKRDSLNSKRNDYISPMLKSDDYISLKREYSSLNKREEYQKRDVDDRHSSYNREDNKQNRYEQTNYRSNRANVDDNRNSTISNKRYEISDHYDRSSSINSSNNWQHSHGLSSSGHGISSIHGGSSINPIKSFVGNGMQSSSVGNSLNWSNKISDDTHWVGRNSENNQDRYDRTYNERSNSSSYIDNGNRSSAYNMMGSGRSMQDRFGSSLARYDSTKY